MGEDDIEEDYYPDCPVCQGLARFLGWLGNLKWFRCPFCGMEFYIESK